MRYKYSTVKIQSFFFADVRMQGVTGYNSDPK